MSSPSRVHLDIHGRVQGVSFRYYARQRAQMLRLEGWVRNSRDGSVEAVVQGDEEAVQQFVIWAHNGPSMARVERVDVTPEDPDDTMQGFHIVGQ